MYFAVSLTIPKKALAQFAYIKSMDNDEANRDR
jgi:hypothetical protein